MFFYEEMHTQNDKRNIFIHNKFQKIKKFVSLYYLTIIHTPKEADFKTFKTFNPSSPSVSGIFFSSTTERKC